MYEDRFGLSRVYFIQSGEHVKIGYTDNVTRRLGQIRAANPNSIELLYAIPGDKVIEALLHHRFRELHERGEWFRKDKIILDFIDTHRNNPDTPIMNW